MPSLAHGGTQCIARDPQLTVEDVKLVCRVTEPCKRQSPGWSPCLGTQDPWLCTPGTLGTAQSLQLCPWGGRSTGTDPTHGPAVML